MVKNIYGQYIFSSLQPLAGVAKISFRHWFHTYGAHKRTKKYEMGEKNYISRFLHSLT